MDYTYSDLSISFNKHPFSDDVLVKYDVDSVKQALFVLFMTNPGEKPFDPKFGIGIRGLLFENWSPVSKLSLLKAIQNQVTYYEPRAVIEDIVLSDEYDTNELTIDFYFYVRGRNKLESLTISFARIR